MPRLMTASLIALTLAAGPALAQPGSTAARPPAGTAAPPPTPAPPPSNPPVTTSPPTTPPPTVTAPPPETTVVETPAVTNQPVQQAAPPPPQQIELSPTEPYPNGLADPFDNVSQADNDRGGGGFPWGLLGLLGLLGLIPWLRGGPKTIYFERELPQDPARPRD